MLSVDIWFLSGVLTSESSGASCSALRGLSLLRALVLIYDFYCFTEIVPAPSRLLRLLYLLLFVFHDCIIFQDLLNLSCRAHPSKILRFLHDKLLSPRT